MLSILLVAAVVVLPGPIWAQSLTSGDIAGTILDPTGAAVVGATVTLKNNETGATETAASSNTGAYRFSLLNPGSCDVSVRATGFQNAQQTVTVAVGEASALNIHLQVASVAETVEVSGPPGIIQTENADVSTGITSDMVANIPNPGNDLSYYVQTAPGATMNTQAGYGNSATYGISATSNLFTVDGMNENDPFLNVNNSGATNLMLGANDVRTATVVNNGYSGEYGSMPGANVNFVTKSGSNNFHGNAQYFWNGRVLNANDLATPI
jgi:Carboxypeptidase regulatory-like domain